MSGHTPGPWVAHEEDGECAVVEALTRDGRYVKREVCHVLDPQNDSQQAANLRLIAAAPDLLNALAGLEEAGAFRVHAGDAEPDWGLCFHAVRAARAAIAKARGGK